MAVEALSFVHVTSTSLFQTGILMSEGAVGKECPKL